MQRKSRNKSRSTSRGQAQNRPPPSRLVGKKNKYVTPGASRATTKMNLTDLQMMARSKGIPFGGLTKMMLVERINHYRA